MPPKANKLSRGRPKKKVTNESNKVTLENQEQTIKDDVESLLEMEKNGIDQYSAQNGFNEDEVNYDFGESGDEQEEISSHTEKNKIISRKRRRSSSKSDSISKSENGNELSEIPSASGDTSVIVLNLGESEKEKSASSPVDEKNNKKISISTDKNKTALANEIEQPEPQQPQSSRSKRYQQQQNLNDSDIQSIPDEKGRTVRKSKDHPDKTRELITLDESAIEQSQPDEQPQSREIVVTQPQRSEQHSVISSTFGESEPEKVSSPDEKHKNSRKRRRSSKYSEEIYDISNIFDDDNVELSESDTDNTRNESVLILEQQNESKSIPINDNNEDFDGFESEEEEISDNDKNDGDWNETNPWKSSAHKAKRKKVSKNTSKGGSPSAIKKASKIKSTNITMKTKPVNNNSAKISAKTSTLPSKKKTWPIILLKGDAVWYVGKAVEKRFISVKDHELENPSSLNGEKLKIDLYVATSENSNHFTKAKKWTSRCVPVGIPLGGKGEKLIGHELFRKFDDYIDEEDVETYFKRHLNPTDYQNLLKKFETVKRVNLEIFDPNEKLEYLTGAKEFKDDDVENKDSSVLIVGEIVTDPTKSSMTSRLGIPGPSSSLDLDTTYEEPRTIIKRNGPSNRLSDVIEIDGREIALKIVGDDMVKYLKKNNNDLRKHLVKIWNGEPSMDCSLVRHNYMDRYNKGIGKTNFDANSDIMKWAGILFLKDNKTCDTINAICQTHFDSDQMANGNMYDHNHFRSHYIQYVLVPESIIYYLMKTEKLEYKEANEIFTKEQCATDDSISKSTVDTSKNSHAAASNNHTYRDPYHDQDRQVQNEDDGLEIPDFDEPFDSDFESENEEKDEKNPSSEVEEDNSVIVIKSSETD